MPLAKFQFKPGFDREGTAYDTEGGWFDGNLIRFNQGRPQKIGGWRKDNDNTFIGTCRALHAWVALNGTKFLGVGTTNKYYIEDGSVFNDITPIRETTGNNAIAFTATVAAGATITATDTAHGAVVGDFVTISGAVSLGDAITAAVLNKEHQIVSVPTANTFTFLASASATSDDDGNGQGTVVGVYQINSGLDVFVESTGWGAGIWSAGTFGSSTALSFNNQLRQWSHDHFGEDLVINPRNGGVFYWDKTSGLTARAVLLSGISGANLVPTVGLQSIVSEKDRHLIVLGADPIDGSARSGVIDPMLVAFSDQENALDFEPLTTNTAGSLRLSEGSMIIGAVKSRQEILIWTDTSLYSMQFVGPPYTFGLNLINNGSGLAGPTAALATSIGVFWMGVDSFFSYTGSVQKLPCSVQSYVFDDINTGQIFKTVAFSNARFDEIGWFYCSSSSIEIDRYVCYDYGDNVWTYGNLSRTAWLDQGIESYPRATSSNYLYEHEFGYNDDGTPMTDVFIESSDFDIGDGESYAFISKIIPDLRFLNNSSNGKVNIVLKTRDFPGESLVTKNTTSIGSTTTRADVRSRSRQAVLRFESDDDASSGNDDVGWRLGSTRLEIRPDGKR